MQQRGEDAPGSIELVISDEVAVVALERVQDERLIGLGDLEVGEASPVGEVELCDDRLHAQARKLAVHLDVHTLVGLDADDKLVAGNVLENARGDILELNADLSLLLVEGLASLEDEGNTVPSLVLDVGDH